MQAMTFMTVTYELQNALKADQFRALGQFANTYGLQRFRFDEKTNRLHFDYDASRLRETVVEHVLREARIPVLRRSLIWLHSACRFERSFRCRCTNTSA
jgi:hypothetical protein